EIPFDWPRGATAGALGRFAGLTPQTELVRDRLLNRLPVREIDRAARAGADEVGFVEGEALGERRHLDQTRDTIGPGGRQAKPIPAAANHFGERADRYAAERLRQGLGCTHEVPCGRGPALAADANRKRGNFWRLGALRLERAPIQDDRDTARGLFAKNRAERRGGQRLKPSADNALDETRIEQRAERRLPHEPHGR